VSDSIDAYLDDLFLSVRLEPAAARRLLREAEDHLREEQERLVAQGAEPDAAASEAIAAFGSVQQILTRADEEDRGGWLRRVLGSLVVAGLWMIAIGLLAIGASGALAWALGSTLGQEFVAGDQEGVTYTAERCLQLQRLEPDAPDCADAAVAHHFAETVGYRLGAGVAGIVVALVAFAARPLARRGPDIHGLFLGAGAALFGAFAFLLLGQGLMELPGGADGSGALLSAGATALPVALAFGALLLRWLRQARPLLSPRT
jgi:hypothetical protein